MNNDSSLHLLVKPTNSCNLKCVYCFNAKKSGSDFLMQISTFENAVKLASKAAKRVEIVWHGGEPLLIGKEFFSEANKIVSKYRKFCEIEQSVQTNLTLLDEEWIDFFAENKIDPGTSFDGVTNHMSRNNTEKYLLNLNLAKSKGMRVGAICVVSKLNIDRLIENYNYFKELKQSVNFNSLIGDGETRFEKLKVKPEENFAALLELFKVWLFDKECNIHVEPFTKMINQIVYGGSADCTTCSCIGHWFCIEPNGDVMPCDRVFPQDYKYGNVNNSASFEEFYNSEGMRELLKKSTQRRAKCIENCEVYKYCQGGCNNNALLQGGIENNGGYTCQSTRMLYKGIEDFLISLDISEIPQINNKITSAVKDFKKISK